MIDSRPAEDKNSIRRRRSCDECGRRFTTYEKVETIPMIVIKKDDNRPDNVRAAGDSADKTYLDRKPPCPSLGGQAAEKRCFTALRTLRI